MKVTRVFSLFLLIPTLCGCVSLQPSRDLEQMRVIQVMGVDRVDGQLQLSLASAPRKSGESSSLLVGSGSSVSGALQRIGRQASEEDLFCAHTDHILLGVEAARYGLDGILGYICQSPEIRMNLPLFVLDNSSAREAMEKLGGGRRSTADLLQAVESALRLQGYSHIFTATEVLRNLERSGSSLICSLSCIPSPEDAQEYTLAVSGYGVLQEGALTAQLDEESAGGAGLIMNTGGVRELSVRDLKGNMVTLELDDSSCRLVPLWTDAGALQALELQLSVRAAVLEIGGKSGPLNNAQYEDHLIAQLEAEVSRQVQKAVLVSKQLGADFLNLGERLSCQAPADRRASLADFAALLPGLEFRLSVSGKLSHSYDIEDKQ